MSQGPIFSIPASNQLSAYLVLRDARASCEELRIAQGEDWRRRWISSLTFLRSVGHVLDKVDGNSSSKARQVINSWWDKIKQDKLEHSIFWNFIEPARNTALKAYSSSVGVEIKPIPKPNSRMTITVKGPAFTLMPESGSSATFSYTETPFEGRDPVELVDEAIRWWANQLALLDERIYRV